jgi:hypothetical protein
MVMSGQLLVPACIAPVFIGEEMGGSWSLYGECGEEKIVVPSVNQTPSIQIVARHYTI